MSFFGTLLYESRVQLLIYGPLRLSCTQRMGFMGTPSHLPRSRHHPFDRCEWFPITTDIPSDQDYAPFSHQEISQFRSSPWSSRSSPLAQ